MAAFRPAITLRLSANLKEKVLRSGYGTVADLSSVPIQDLATELKLSPEQSRELSYQLYPTSTSWVSFTANQTLEHERKWMPITTSSTALNSLFGGGQGIPPGKITEICGLAGSGKTQLGLQLCINAQIPCSAGGAGGTAIFVDTEGSFVAKRVAQLAAACSERLGGLAHNVGDTSSIITTEGLMQGIQYCRVHSSVELIAMIRMLDGIVQAHPKTKLIVIDSIAFLFRSNFSDMNARTKLVATLGRQLATLARGYDIAMATKIESHQGQSSYQSSEHSSTSNQVQPALGDTWANMCTHRIRLYHSHADGERSARLFKSPTIQEQTVLFQIGYEGITDVEDVSSFQALGSPANDEISFGLDNDEAFWDVEA
ncbi:DNA repair protein rad51c [Modicella reniformis]|uniref:DNA repair protein RAD51 homolog 3 n=1 Tax=Modicella reniformis TaxID=1440133 RepID=A0A9P6IKJ6_9FUNG|nr:DNA repair protein rad51c [Modicella reniformis]